MTSKLSLQHINTLDAAGFVKLLGGIFEHSAWVAEQVVAMRPFSSVAALHAAMVAQIEAVSRERQIALIRVHPELAGKAAVRGELTDESTREQSGAGLNQCTAEEFEKLQQLNAAYNAKFGFPFIVAVRGHTRHSIMALFEERLKNTPEVEMRECLNQIFKIGRLRLDDCLTG
jgi:2-oxo-4-hydroxy-4-carboxy-5-ureidoimidazoline decarboxylase